MQHLKLKDKILTIIMGICLILWISTSIAAAIITIVIWFCCMIKGIAPYNSFTDLFFGAKIHCLIIFSIVCFAIAFTISAYESWRQKKEK